MSKNALITGITGQDGSYLAEFLLDKGYHAPTVYFPLLVPECFLIEPTETESKEELANRFKEELSVIPGIDYEFTQPIEMRFNELITGVRADLAIKIFGDDLTILADKAQEVKRLIDGVPGAADVILYLVRPTNGAEPFMVSLPRDLYVENPCTGGNTRINGSHKVEIGRCHMQRDTRCGNFAQPLDNIESAF